MSVAPVKSLGLVSVDAVELERAGVRGDRRLYLVDGEGALANAKRFPRLLAVQPTVQGSSLELRFPDGTVIVDEIVPGAPVRTSFYGRSVAGRIVEGAWNEALSDLVGRQLRVAQTERDGDGHDRGPDAGASLVSTASLDALRAAAGAAEAVDGRRFRMTIGVDGVGPHEEDEWIGGRARVGSAVVLVRARVGRCAVTTLDPDRGIRDFDTLGAIAAYRGAVPTQEPLPFGVWCEVVERGPVAVGDPVAPE